MQRFHCRCGQIVFCDSASCGNCGRTLAFEPTTGRMLSLDPAPGGGLTDAEGERFWNCANRNAHGICNGVVAAEASNEGQRLCSGCSLNRTIPVIVRRPKNTQRWRILERAKRRMLAGVYRLGLDATVSCHGAMRFDFMEDKRSHPDVLESFVATGHKNGVITINVTEADSSKRVQQRELLGERYRTVLGHFRHEAGHFFYPELVIDRDSFTALFGNPDEDYNSALQHYYAQGPQPDWEQHWISAYASSHPLEDWAECFAHYLHICDAFETAVVIGLAEDPGDRLEDRLRAWMQVSVQINEMSRSLGQGDPYPFVLTDGIMAKLVYVENTIRNRG